MHQNISKTTKLGQIMPQKFTEFVKKLTPQQLKIYAENSGTKPVYLGHIRLGHSQASPKLARDLAEQSGWAFHPAELNRVFDGIPSQAEIDQRNAEDEDEAV